MKIRKIIFFTIITFFTINFNFKLEADDFITGFTKVIDGDTIHIDTHKIRLESIDAPEIKQRCKKPFIKISFLTDLSLSKDYLCGVVSKKKLINKIDNKEINCKISTKDKYNRYLATCFKGKENINQWLVKNGYAVAYRRYSNRYIKDENYARANKLGIWEGTFKHPEKWRKLN